MTGAGAVLAARSFRSVAVATLLPTLLLSAAACAPQREPLYRWGQYESVLYSMWIEPGTADPVDASTRLAADLVATEAAGARVPPGLHAHLGWLYWLQGLEAEARAEFAAERTLFPESAPLIDDMLARMDGRVSEPGGSGASASDPGESDPGASDTGESE